MYENKFEKLMDYLFVNEGGYSNNKKDKGGATNYGIKQSTFDNWRTYKKQAKENVKNITKTEAKEIYYNWYWKASGADKEKDLRDAYVLFDTAVQYGDVSARKQFKDADRNLYKLLQNRKLQYKNTVEKDPTQKEFLKGWMNRLEKIEHTTDELIRNNIYKPPYRDEITPFDEKYTGGLNKIDATKYGKDDIEHLKNKYQYYLNKNSQKGYFTGYAAPINDGNTFFATEDIAKMSTDEFLAAEDIINNQIKNKIAIPKSQANHGVSSGAYIYVNEYTRDDGTKVSGYYRRR